MYLASNQQLEVLVDIAILAASVEITGNRGDSEI